MVSSARLGLGHLIDRPLLRAELDQAFDRRLTLIVAQAGAGKSTLLRQWAAAHPEHQFAFLEIEPADDQPAHFFRRLMADLAEVEPSLADVARLLGEQNAGLSPRVISSLAGALKTLRDVVIVVDDAQRLSNVHLVAQLGELVARTPHNLHLVVSSRSDPPIALSKYRLADELVELRQADLAFTDHEAAELLERITGRSLSGANVRALCERTEGWVAGLQLAGLNLRHARDPDAFIAEFGGSDRLVADYLGEEVLAGLPEGQRELLLQMSALDDMSAELVQAVTGCSDAQGVLGRLQRDSMFLVQLDTRREWFRFHHLFRELLRSRLNAENSSLEREILGAAAKWQLARGSAKSAVEYLLRARLWDCALDAILSNAVDVVAHGDMLTVVRWMQQIPESVRSERVIDRFLPGALELMNHDTPIPDGIPRTGRTEQLDQAGVQSPGLGLLAAQMLFSTHPQMAATAVRRQLDESEPTPRTPIGVATPVAGKLRQTLIAAGRASFLAGEMDRARELLTRSLAGPSRNPPEHVRALSTLSLLEAWCGNLRHAETLICEALLAAGEAGMLSDPAVTDAYLASVLTALKGADAREPFEPEALPELGPQGVPGKSRNVLFDRAVSSLALGDSQAARAIVSAWEEPVVEAEPLQEVQRRILLAWIAVNDNDSVEGTRQLTEAVRVAEIHGVVKVFVQAGPLILALLGDVAGPQAAFRDIILASAQQSMDPRRRHGPAEPLTDRELEILSYLPTRFTNVELAERCFVSINTIKTHMVHIYRKLDATDRDTAISRARVLGLL